MSSRIHWIDTAKGAAIICVVLGHAITGPIRETNDFLGIVYELLYLFHMPLFMFLSGYLFQWSENSYQSQTIASFIKKRAKRLMIPYFVYSLFTYSVVAIFSAFPFMNNVLATKGLTISGPLDVLLGILFWQNSLDQHLWFIYCLFLIDIYNRLFIAKLPRNPIPHILAALLINILFLRCSIDLLTRFSGFLIYFVLGRFCCKRGLFSNEGFKHRFKLAVPVLLLLVVVRLMTIDVIFGSHLLTMAKALFSIVVSTGLVILACILFQKLDNTKIAVILDGIYKYSFDIYLYHQPFVVPGIVFILSTLMAGGFVLDILKVLISTVLGICISIIISRLVSKIQSKFKCNKRQRLNMKQE